MAGSDDDTKDDGADAAAGEGWTPRRVPAALGEASDAVLEALGGALELAAAEARRDAEDRLAVLRAVVGDELAAVKASMGRIRDALGEGVPTPVRDPAEERASGTPRAIEPEPRSGIDAPKVVEPDAGASRNPSGTRPGPRPDAAPKTAGRKKRAARNGTEEPGISAGSVPAQVDARIEAIVATGEFADWPSAAIGLILEALAKRAAPTHDATVRAPR